MLDRAGQPDRVEARHIEGVFERNAQGQMSVEQPDVEIEVDPHIAVDDDQTGRICIT